MKIFPIRYPSNSSLNLGSYIAPDLWLDIAKPN